MAQNIIPPQVKLAARAVSFSIRGIVQGVGFRPFIYTLALRYSLAGWVRNTSSGVVVHLEGLPIDLERWLTALQQEVPPLARITSIEENPAEYQGYTSFTILTSTTELGA